MGNKPSMPDLNDIYIDDFIMLSGMRFNADGSSEILTDEQNQYIFDKYNNLWGDRWYHSLFNQLKHGDDALISDGIDREYLKKQIKRRKLYRDYYYDYVGDKNGQAVFKKHYTLAWPSDITEQSVYDTRFCIVDKTLMDYLNSQYQSIGRTLSVFSLPSNQPIGIASNYYVMLGSFMDQLQWQLNDDIHNNRITQDQIPNTNMFAFNVDNDTSMTNDDLNYFGIPFDAIEALNITVEVGFGILAFFTFGIAALVKRIIAIMVEIAMQQGAFNALIDVLTNLTSDVIGIPDITDLEAELDPLLDVVKQPFENVMSHFDVVTAIDNLDFDSIPFDELTQYMTVVRGIIPDMDISITGMASSIEDFALAMPGYIEDGAKYFCQNILTNPIFWGIVAGMLALTVVAGKACIKFLKSMCKSIAAKVRSFVNRNYQKIQKAFQRKLNKVRQRLQSAKAKLDKFEKKYLERQKKEAKKLKSKIEEEEQQIKEFLKKDFKEQLQEIKDKLNIDIGSSNFDFGNYIQNNKKFLAGSTSLGVGLLSAIMQRSDHFTGPLKELGRALIDIGKYGYETAIILLVLLPFLIIQYICWYIIYVLEKNYLDRNKGLLV